MTIDYTRFPNPALTHAVQRYINHGIPMGSFGMAIVENDLKLACACADDVNRHLIYEIVSWFWTYAPSNCWGSYEKVQEWINKKQTNTNPGKENEDAMD